MQDAAIRVRGSSFLPHCKPNLPGVFVEDAGEERIRGRVPSFQVEAEPGKIRSVF